MIYILLSVRYSVTAFVATRDVGSIHFRGSPQTENVHVNKIFMQHNRVIHRAYMCLLIVFIYSYHLTHLSPCYKDQAHEKVK